MAEKPKLLGDETQGPRGLLVLAALSITSALLPASLPRRFVCFCTVPTAGVLTSSFAPMIGAWSDFFG
jgi:hypothetical protein